MSKKTILIFLILIFASCANSLNIVFYINVIAQTHVSFFTKSINLLLSRGHNIDIVYAKLNDRVILKDITGVKNVYEIEFAEKNHWHNNMAYLGNPFIKPSRPFLDLPTYDGLALELCDIAVKDDNLLNFLKKGEYDIGIFSDYDPCAAIMMRAANIPSTAALLPTAMFQNHILNAGLPSPSSIYGTTIVPENDGSFYDKMFHFIKSGYNIFWRLPKFYSGFDSLTRAKFGKSFPSTKTIEEEVDILFVNSNEIIERPRPISHKIKYIGGIGVPKAKPLSKEIDELLNTSSKGTVIFSFGTQIPTKRVPIEIRRNFVKAFKKFPDFLFLWKYDNVTEDQELFKDANNVKRIEWLPQTDLLQDERVKCFISHMGMNSFIETSILGIPVLSIPLIVDQQHNSQNAQNRETGIIVDRDSLTSENIEKALSKLLFDSKYMENAKKIGKLMRDKPEQSEKLFIEWLEYVGNNPGFHNIVNLPNISTFFYYSGDVILFVFSFIVFTTWFLYRFVFSKIRISISSSKKIKDN
ncbi:unnamed protein product [Caenorhabditis angaria]|uniref:glucuronosyltransferase n=1 Tax=Caenorhabditis angaria TaxID=860376 RepID=A0A9P1N5R7_9PELO|nr:unnamed protein product [Caenorhabditis angaria]